MDFNSIDPYSDAGCMQTMQPVKKMNVVVSISWVLRFQKKTSDRHLLVHTNGWKNTTGPAM